MKTPRLLVSFFCFCTILSASSKEITRSELIGAWSEPLQPGHSLVIEFMDNGNYFASWLGCCGVSGESEGTWMIDGSIELSPTEETDTVQGHLTELIVRTTEDGIILIRQEAVDDEHAGVFTKDPRF